VSSTGDAPGVEERRRRVLAAALELAGEGGYDAVQMRDVAARSGVAMGTLYRYFDSKDHLLAACQVEQIEAIRGRLRRRPVRGGSSYERVMTVVDRATRAMERSPLATAALLRAIASPDPAVPPCQAQAAGAMASMLDEAMDGVEARRRAAITRVLGHVWFSALLGWVNGWSTVGEVRSELEEATGLLLDGADPPATGGDGSVG